MNDPRLQFIHELLDEHASIAGDIVEVGTDTWAIHGVIPVDGGVIVAEFDTYREARLALDGLSIGTEGVTTQAMSSTPGRGRDAF